VDEDRSHQAWADALVQALQDGTVLDLAPGEDVDVSQAAGWPASCRLPGEALRAALLNSAVWPDPRGLKIRAAYITGTTDLADLRVPYGLHFDSCAFEQSADWSRMAVASLQLTGCTMSSLTLDYAPISAVLSLSGSTLRNDGGIALSLDGADIKGDAFLNLLNATGEVRALGATVGGQFILRGATLTNEGGIALSLDGADLKLGAFLSPVKITGGLRAVRTTIAGQLDLEGAMLNNEGGIALSLDDADIRGSTFLNLMNATGEVRALGAIIGGQLNLQGATLTNAGADALSLDRADIKSYAFLNQVDVTGELRAPGATFGGQLILHGATLTNKGGIALRLHSARLTDLILTPAAVKGGMMLAGAQIDVLTTPDDKSTMRVLIGSELSASGWRLGDIRGRIRQDKKAAADWLSRDNAAKEFAAQPWHELANVYDRNGQPADARWMRWKAAQGVTRTSPWWSKPIRRVYGALVGHGYYPLIAAVWLIVAVVTSGLIVAANPAVFTPTATNKAAWKIPPPVGQAPPITGATPCQDLQDRSSCLNPVLYAFDNSLPGTLATGQAAQWTANGAQGWSMWIPYTLGGLKIASWIFVALLLAGVTGLLRKT
jgi:hypothetical protein